MANKKRINPLIGKIGWCDASSLGLSKGHYVFIRRVYGNKCSVNTFTSIKNPNGYYSNKTSMLTYDEYGRFICYATIWIENNAASQRYLVMLFQKDLTFSILEPQSIFSYQEELAEFKRANNWHCE